MQAAAVAAGPGDTIAAMADAVIAHRLDVAEQVITALAQLFAFTDPYDGESAKRFIDKAVSVLSAGQTSVAKTTAAAQSAQLAAQGVRVPPTVPSDPVDVRAPRVRIVEGVAELDRSPVTVTYRDDDKADPKDTTSVKVPPSAKKSTSSSTPSSTAVRSRSRVKVTIRDSSTAEVLNRPLRTYRYEKSRGASEKDAREAAKARVSVIVDDNLMLAQRLAEAETLAQAADLDDTVIGYRRIVHPELSRGGVCGMCLVASDREYKIGELKPIHNRCWCTVAAITEDYDPVTLNADDLKRFYEDAKGNDRASLKRTRYKVDEHGELGAVLVPKAKHRSRAQRAEDRAKAAAEKKAAKPSPGAMPK